MKIPAIFLVILVLCGCNRTEPTPGPPVMPPEAQPSLAAPSPSASPAPEWLASGATHRVAEITSAPKAFIGKTVTVVAEVEDIYDPRAFTLSGEDGNSSGVKGAGKDLLTLIPKVGGFPTVEPQWKGSKARVTGVVQRMEPKYIEREIGWPMPSSLESKFRGRPALLARSVERLAE
jgi:hypothetical protein